MQPEFVEYSIGERSLTKLVKYHQRESLLLEIDSINDYMSILAKASKTVYDEDMEAKASAITKTEKDLENLCVEMNQGLLQLVDCKQPLEDSLLKAKEVIENIIYSYICIDRDYKVTNILEKELILKFFYEALADLQNFAPLQVDKQTQNQIERRLAEYCKQDASVCDYENEGRISSQYTVYYRNYLSLILQEYQLVRDYRDKLIAEYNAKQSSGCDQELQQVEYSFVAEYAAVKSRDAYNKSVYWLNEYLQQIDPGLFPFERKLNCSHYLTAIRAHYPRQCDFTEILRLQKEIRYKFDSFGHQEGIDELERFQTIYSKFFYLTADMGRVFEEIKESKTESCEILEGGVEDIYKAFYGLQQCNLQVYAVTKAYFYAKTNGCEEVNELIKKYNYKVADLQRFQNDLRQFLLAIKEQEQKLPYSKSITKYAPDDFEQLAHDVVSRVGELTDKLKEFKILLYEQESVNASISLLNKYIEKQTSPFVYRYMMENAAQYCQFCKEKIWNFVEIDSGYKYCEDCANRKFRGFQGGKFEDQFIYARFD